MRGRYMAVSGLSWSLSFMVGPYFAGLILDGSNPNLLWILCGFIGILGTLGFATLNKTHRSARQVPEPAATD
jgi:MFS family permease